MCHYSLSTPVWAPPRGRAPAAALVYASSALCWALRTCLFAFLPANTTLPWLRYRAGRHTLTARIHCLSYICCTPFPLHTGTRTPTPRFRLHPSGTDSLRLLPRRQILLTTHRLDISGIKHAHGKTGARLNAAGCKHTPDVARGESRRLQPLTPGAGVVHAACTPPTPPAPTPAGLRNAGMHSQQLLQQALYYTYARRAGRRFAFPLPAPYCLCHFLATPHRHRHRGYPWDSVVRSRPGRLDAQRVHCAGRDRQQSTRPHAYARTRDVSLSQLRRWAAGRISWVFYNENLIRCDGLFI